MLPEYQIVTANQTNVSEFLLKLGPGAKYFRYFQSRPLNIIDQHLVTLIALNHLQHPVAYGHLEKEGGRLWLGVAVADDQSRKGLGSLIVGRLIEFAVKHSEPIISLAVDKTNLRAISLYEKFLFKKKKTMADWLLFELELC